jgi:hypothetical protein
MKCIIQIIIFSLNIKKVGVIVVVARAQGTPHTIERRYSYSAFRITVNKLFKILIGINFYQIINHNSQSINTMAII